VGEWKRMYFMTPTLRPVGGVVKIFDYVNHARSFGYEPVIACPESYEPGLPLFEIPRFSGISPENGVRFTALNKVAVGPHDLAFLSWPTHYEIVEPRLSRWTRHEQVIFIVQNVRWANPSFTEGYALRLLSRPMARIMTNDVVLEAVKPYLNPSSMSEVILLGNESSFFAKERRGGFGNPVRIGYTTWKSGVGDEVARMLADDPRFKFRAIREPVGWRELRKLYHWSDVFLATPLVEEGFYMPGLEEFGDASSYVDTLQSLKTYSIDDMNRLRRGGYETAGLHTLTHERERFGEFMERLIARLDRLDLGAHPLDASRRGAT
jgi:hypothetical protein